MRLLALLLSLTACSSEGGPSDAGTAAGDARTCLYVSRRDCQELDACNEQGGCLTYCQRVPICLECTVGETCAALGATCEDEFCASWEPWDPFDPDSTNPSEDGSYCPCS